jgi:hypothetical protein
MIPSSTNERSATMRETIAGSLISVVKQHSGGNSLGDPLQRCVPN